MSAIKQIVAVICFAVTLTLPQMALSHSDGHGHQVAPPTTEQVVDTASKYLQNLIEKGTQVEGAALPASWKNISEKKLFKKTVRSYIVSFKNQDKSKTLYILMDSRGYYQDANFSGKFEQ